MGISLSVWDSFASGKALSFFTALAALGSAGAAIVTYISNNRFNHFQQRMQESDIAKSYRLAMRELQTHLSVFEDNIMESFIVYHSDRVRQKIVTKLVDTEHDEAIKQRLWEGVDSISAFYGATYDNVTNNVKDLIRAKQQLSSQVASFSLNSKLIRNLVDINDRENQLISEHDGKRAKKGYYDPEFGQVEDYIQALWGTLDNYQKSRWGVTGDTNIKKLADFVQSRGTESLYAAFMDYVAAKEKTFAGNYLTPTPDNGTRKKK